MQTPSRYFVVAFIWALTLNFCWAQGQRSASHRKPNIVYIMADDLGYGEIGAYGQTKINTPNLDRLAQKGMKFNQFYASSAVCAPTRGSLMTGLHIGHAQVRDNEEFGGFKDDEEQGQLPLAENTMTIARLLKNNGYTTALIGKWGLGGPNSVGVPNKQGFDYFFGYLDQKQAHNYYPSHLWRNETWTKLNNEYFSPHQKLQGDPNDPKSYDAFKGKEYASDTMTEDATRWIKDNKSKPFFLYLAYTQPHLSLQVPDEELAQYDGKFEESPYIGDKGYLPHIRPRSAYAAMISRLDRYVGQVWDTLKAEGLEDNTIIFFTSDNGTTHVPSQADYTFFNSTGGLRGLKGSMYEGGIRVPMIAYWNRKIRPNTTTNHIAASYDVFATLADIAGIRQTSTTDGISFLPSLLGRTRQQRNHEYLYWEIHDYGNGIQAVRWGDWKAVRQGVHKNPDAPIELFNLATDRNETTNVAAQHPEIVAQMRQRLFDAHQPAVLPAWNFTGIRRE
jgi:arylsulfatase A-like enzyme